MHMQKQLHIYLKRALRTSMALTTRSLTVSVAAAHALRSRRANGSGRVWGRASAAESSLFGSEVARPPATTSAERELSPRIDLARFDDEEYEALGTGEWGVGWRMNERAINCRQVLAGSLSEFLENIEPEKTH